MAAVGGIVSPLATWAALAIGGLAAPWWSARRWSRGAPPGSPAWRERCWRLALAGAIWSAGPLRGIDWLAAGAIGLGAGGAARARRTRPAAVPGAGGLVRPEAWLLPPLVLRRRPPGRAAGRRLGHRARPGCGSLFDGVLLGDPLLAFHRTTRWPASPRPARGWSAWSS